MAATPNPTQLPTLVDDGTVMRHRSLFCTRYDDCLERAAEAGWRSFTCESCPFFARRREMAVLFARANYHPAEQSEIAAAG